VVQSIATSVDRYMRRPSNLMTSTMAAETAPAQAASGSPPNYLDLYGLSKPPFGGTSEGAGYIVFDSHRRALDLLIAHVVNGSGVIVLQGEEGVGKTQALRSVAAVATDWDLKAIVVVRPPNERTSLTQLLSALEGRSDAEPQPGRSGQTDPIRQFGPRDRHGPQSQSGSQDQSGSEGKHGPSGQSDPNDPARLDAAAIDDTIRTFLLPPKKALLVDDIDLMPEESVRLLLTLVRQTSSDPSGPAIVVSSSADLAGVTKRPNLSELVSLARDTVRLSRLGHSEIRQYIERSLWIAGGSTRRLIASDAMRVLLTRSGGTPGMTNRLMEAVLTAGFARGDSMITAKTVAAAAGPTAPRPQYREDVSPGLTGRVVPIIAIGLLVLGAVVFLYRGLTAELDHPAPPVARHAAPAEPPGGADIVPQTEQNSSVAATPMEPPGAKPAETLSPALMAALMKRGDQSVGLGDIAAARLLYRRAADAGNAPASTALGKTYDPSFVPSGQAPDPARAAEWYRKAVALGDAHAADLLKRLESH
jgi:type II secretory pathway predicted ATPase ExeA